METKTVFETDNPRNARGLYLVEPHGEMIADGRKTAILKSKPFDLAGNWILVSGKLAYGDLQLAGPEPISLKEFGERAEKHQVADADRLRWWPEKETLYYYKVLSFEPYEQPKRVAVPPGTQTVMREVEFSRADKVLERLQELPDRIVWIPGYVSLTGSQVYGDKDREPNDTDVVLRADVRDGRFFVEADAAFALKLERAFEATVGGDVQYIPNAYGPNWPHYELYDLCLVRRPEIRLQEMNEPEFADLVHKDHSPPNQVANQYGLTEAKRESRKIAADAARGNWAVDLFTGGGYLKKFYQRRGFSVVSNDIDESEPARFHMKAEEFIRERLSNYWPCALLDLDPHGSPSEELKALCEFLKTAKRSSFVLAVTDGGLYNAQARGKFKESSYWYGSDDVRQITKDDYESYEKYLRHLVKQVAKRSGYQASELDLRRNSQNNALYGAWKFSPTKTKATYLTQYSDVAGRRWAGPDIEANSLQEAEEQLESLQVIGELVEEMKLTKSALDRLLRGATAKIKAQAKKSFDEDKIIPGRAFVPLKPLRPVPEGERQLISAFYKFIEDNDLLPVYISPKRDGVRHTIHRKGDEITILSDDGNDNTDKLPILVNRLQKFGKGDWVLDAEIELWRGGQHFPREAANAAVQTGDDEDLAINVFRLLHWNGKDLHNEPFIDVWKQMQELPVDTKSGGRLHPRRDGPINLVPHRKVETTDELQRVTESVAYKPGVEGVVVKRTAGIYPLDGQPGTRKPTAVKWHKNFSAVATITGKTETKTPGVFVYEYKLGDLEAGKTFGTALKLKPGEKFVIEGETLNIERDHDRNITDVSIWVPSAIEETDAKAEELDTIIQRAKDHGVLQEKVRAEDGSVEFLPSDPGKPATADKQRQTNADLYPDEDKELRFTYQHHYRGKSVHGDFRAEYRRDDRNFLRGWTVADQIADAIKEPVTTKAEAEKADRNPDNWKMNLKTGKIKPRRIRDGTVRRGELRVFPKAAEVPRDWLDEEGVTEKPDPGEPVPVGATREFPGVFTILDKGMVEWGVMKPGAKEFFIDGGKWKGRWMFRLIQRGEKELEEELWEKIYPGGFECTGEKQGVLPPGEEEERPREASFWVLMQPESQQPNVFSKKSIKDRWLPPKGISALPKKIRDSVPPELRYWEQPGEKALESRRKLAEEFEELGGPDLKQRAGEFVLTRRTFKGQVVVRAGPSTVIYDLFVKTPTGVWRMEFAGDPRKGEVAGTAEKGTKLQTDDGARDVFDLDRGQIVDLKPTEGRGFNPTKDTPAQLEIVDKDEALELSAESTHRKYDFKGDELKGTYFFRAENPREPGGIWIASKSEGPKTKEQVSRSSCMKCKKRPAVDVHWADGRGRAWFCLPHFEEWAKSEDREIVRAWCVPGGEVPKKLKDHDPRCQVLALGRKFDLEKLLARLRGHLETKEQDMMEMTVLIDDEQLEDEKRKLTRAEIDALPDSSFLFIEPGGRVEDGKTRPLSLRHLPYRDSDGSILVPQLRDAIDRAPDVEDKDGNKLPKSKVRELQEKARTLLAEAGVQMERAVISSTTGALSAQIKGGRRVRGDKLSALQKLQERLQKEFAEALAALKDFMKWATYREEEFDLSELLSNKQLAEALETGESAAFAFKGLDDKLWWFQFTTNAFRDREKEIFTTKAIEDYVTRNENKDVKGEFWFWHIPGTKFGTVRWQAVIGRFLGQAGPFDDTKIGQAFKNFFTRYPLGHPDIASNGWGTSHGYSYKREDREDGIYNWFNIHESTVLPADVASNPYNPMPFILQEAKQMNKAQEDALLKIGGRELFDLVVGTGREQTKKLEEDPDVDYKAKGSFASRIRAIAGKVKDDGLKQRLMDFAGKVEEAYPYPAPKEKEGQGEKAGKMEKFGKELRMLAGQVGGSEGTALKKIADEMLALGTKQDEETAETPAEEPTGEPVPEPEDEETTRTPPETEAAPAETPNEEEADKYASKEEVGTVLQAVVEGLRSETQAALTEVVESIKVLAEAIKPLAEEVKVLKASDEERLAKVVEEVRTTTPASSFDAIVQGLFGATSAKVASDDPLASAGPQERPPDDAAGVTPVPFLNQFIANLDQQ